MQPQPDNAWSTTMAAVGDSLGFSLGQLFGMIKASHPLHTLIRSSPYIYKGLRHSTMAVASSHMDHMEQPKPVYAWVLSHSGSRRRLFSACCFGHLSQHSKSHNYRI